MLDQTFGAKWLFDLAFSYKTNGWEFTVGGDNVLDEYPDENLYIFAGAQHLDHGPVAVPVAESVRLQRRLHVRTHRLQVVMHTAS